MKQHYVFTSNHKIFMAALTAVENRGSPEACILLLTGAPGTGKSRTVDHWGAGADALYLEGIPGMSITFLRDYLADQTACFGARKFAQHKALVEHFSRTRQPIILDEAQHGLANKAECIEYLRRIAEQAGVILVLICHTSERHRFAAQDKLAHITDRITARPELKLASLDDAAEYLTALCEVGTDRGIAAQVHEQSRGRYRLMANAVRTLEAVAAKKGVLALTAADTAKLKLCEDAMRALKKTDPATAGDLKKAVA